MLYSALLNESGHHVKQKERKCDIIKVIISRVNILYVCWSDFQCNLTELCLHLKVTLPLLPSNFYETVIIDCLFWGCASST